MADPKDNEQVEVTQDQAARAGRIESPDGLDLHPQPRRVVRISKRAGMAVILTAIGLLMAYAYGGYRRTAKAQAAAREAGVPKNPVPATQAAREVTKTIPEGIAPLTARTETPELHAPGAPMPAKDNLPCGGYTQTGLPYRFNPQTGQPCEALPQERVVIRQAAPIPVLPKEPSEQERSIAAAYAREQEARIAPTSIRNSPGASLTPPNPEAQSSLNGLAQIAALTQSATNRGIEHAPSATTLAPQSESEYDEQNMQTRKESFWAGSRNHPSADYLNSTREAPLSRFEIRAGWEIPAVLEQSLNSDLPGDLKALITANVYDTATGQYLLIPQGSRLVGRYDSRVAYGQDGVQVAWSRVIFPDASSIDLNGMAGLDAHGNAGLRDKVYRHYARIVGFSALTSLFSAAFAVSQRQNQSVLAYPTPTEAASSAVAQSLSQTGSQITRRNLNVQPTIKVPVGYKFTVRVNRDILFEAPYEPIGPGTPLPERMLRDRSFQQRN